MEIAWAQTLTIVISMAGISFWIGLFSKEDADKIREETKRHDADFQETRKLWPGLPQKSAEIEKENGVVKQALLDIKNKSFDTEQEIRGLIKKL